MGFLRNKKGSIISDYFQLMEDVSSFSKGNMYGVSLYQDHLEIESLQKKKLILNYNQITDVFYGMETEIKEKSKSVIGRAAVGGLLFGFTGAVVGAVSGSDKKQKKEHHFYFIVSYTGSDGSNKYLQFEDTRMYKGKKLARTLTDLVDIKPEEIPDVTLL